MDLPGLVAQSHSIEPRVAIEGGTFRVENDLIVSSENQLGARPHSQSTAREHDNAFSKSIGRASADGAFHCIRYGVFNGQPACHICFDVSIDVGSGRKIKSLCVKMVVSSERSRDESVTSLPDVVVFPQVPPNAFGPKELYGPIIEERRRTTNTVSFELGSAFGSVTTPTHETESEWIQENRWSLHGFRRANGLDRRYRIVTWTLYGTKLVQETMPRRFRLGLIVEHGNEPFDLAFEHVGTLREKSKFLNFGGRRCQHVFRFLPPHGASDVLTEDLLERCLHEVNGQLNN